jgi:hypothetical protein
VFQTLLKNTHKLHLYLIPEDLSLVLEPEVMLHVGADIIAEGSILAKQDVLLESDRRIKDQITPIQDPIGMLKTINGYIYVLKKDETKRKHIGLIAQEVLETLPEVVSKSAKGIYSVAYGNIVAVLIEAVKTLDERLIAYSLRIEDLENIVNHHN